MNPYASPTSIPCHDPVAKALQVLFELLIAVLAVIAFPVVACYGTYECFLDIADGQPKGPAILGVCCLQSLSCLHVWAFTTILIEHGVI
jgi:hypothetical protein